MIINMLGFNDTEVKLLKDVVTKPQIKVSCLKSWVGGLVH